MEPKPLEIYWKEWTYIKDRLLDRGQVYRRFDSSQYLRTGTIEEINAEVGFVRNLRQRGFPVPEVLGQGEINGLGYYTERSVGKVSLGEHFQSEYVSQGKVSDTTFTAYCEMTCKFLAAQLDPANRINGESDLRKGIHLANVLEENPDIDADQIERYVTKIEDKLQIPPLTLTHGDLSPFNMFEEGIIDFEHKFIAPVGYDVLTSATDQRFWNYTGVDGKTQLEYDLSAGQIAYYLDRIDAVAKQHGVEGFLKFTDEFVLLKAIWSLAHEKEFASQSGNILKWDFRKAVLIYCMEQYLHNEPIDTNKFKELNRQ